MYLINNADPIMDITNDGMTRGNCAKKMSICVVSSTVATRLFMK